jgi:hypothetical protein
VAIPTSAWGAGGVIAVRGDTGTSAAGLPGTAFYTITETGTQLPSYFAGQGLDRNKISAIISRFAIVGDICVVKTANTTTPSGGFRCTTAQSSTSNGAWTTAAVFISGDLIVDGSIGADQITSNSISTDKLTVGGGSGRTDRLFLENNKITIYDGSIARVVLGDLS